MAAPVLSFEDLGLIQGSGWLFRGLDLFVAPRDRLAWRANAPMQPRKPQRPADHGLFDTNARNQIEMFG